jgi:hypothetical protein
VFAGLLAVAAAVVTVRLLSHRPTARSKRRKRRPRWRKSKLSLFAVTWRHRVHGRTIRAIYGPCWRHRVHGRTIRAIYGPCHSWGQSSPPFLNSTPAHSRASLILRTIRSEGTPGAAFETANSGFRDAGVSRQGFLRSTEQLSRGPNVLAGDHPQRPLAIPGSPRSLAGQPFLSLTTPGRSSPPNRV